MKCTSPVVIKSQAHGCGQCLGCRINRRRLWTHRILLESYLHEQNSFLTLTYSEENLPRNEKNNAPTLSPVHLKNFLKRIRERVSPLKLRYYAIGEYGDETQRPHYHLVAFGAQNCSYGQTQFSKRSSKCCPACDLVNETWSYGAAYQGEVNEQTAAYVAGYVVKKMTSKDDKRLDGRHPEFARMSLKPGIGGDFVPEIASSFMAYDTGSEDVPGVLSHGRKLYPLGRYLTRRLRVMSGKIADTPETTKIKVAAELSELRLAAFENSKSFAETIREARQGDALNQAAKEKIWKQRKTI